jgi:hypothetical protein
MRTVPKLVEIDARKTGLRFALAVARPARRSFGKFSYVGRLGRSSGMRITADRLDIGILFPANALPNQPNDRRLTVPKQRRLLRTVTSCLASR